MSLDRVHNLFPTTVFETEIEREFTQSEMDSILFHKTQLNPNIGNKTSINTRILDLEEFKDIRAFIQSKIEVYARDVMKVPPEIEVYITQSWLNFTEPGEYHHKHNHPNSIFSGVLYIDAVGAEDAISFFVDRTPLRGMLNIQPTEFNLYNSPNWYLSANTGHMVLFPSYLYHLVENTKSNHTRISLAFNTYVKGVVGLEAHLTELTFK